MKRIAIVLAPTTFFMALYFAISTLLIEQRQAQNEEEEAETTEIVRAESEDDKLKNKQPKVQPNTQLD
jgi:phosphotransferase system  glucose/maltose/N-acetylglucosamine-specific IIC component